MCRPQGKRKPPVIRRLCRHDSKLSSLDTIYRADRNAVLAVGLVLTLIAGGRVDDVYIPLRNGTRGAFRQTESARCTLVSYFHSHKTTSSDAKPIRLIHTIRGQYTAMLRPHKSLFTFSAKMFLPLKSPNATSRLRNLHEVPGECSEPAQTGSGQLGNAPNVLQKLDGALYLYKGKMDPLSGLTLIAGC